MWNVAITRARSTLCVVGHQEFWAQQAGAVGDVLDAADSISLPPEEAAGYDAADRIGEALARTDVSYRLDVRIGGYGCDVLLDRPAGQIALLVDAGGGGRRLRQLLQRARALERTGVSRALRLPAWRCLDHPDQLVASLTGAQSPPSQRENRCFPSSAG